MDNDLISKKELLSLTGISYGQLYRWKRKGLIPEDWFVRRSTFTGQETFFPRDKILERVGRIKGMKDDISLDDLAGVFSPETGPVRLGAKEAAERGIAPGAVVDIFASRFGEGDYGFDDLTLLSVLSELLETGGISRDEALAALDVVKKGAAEFKDGFCELFCLRKLGVLTCFAAASPCDLRFEDGAKLAAHISVPAAREKLKLKLL